MQSRNEQLIKPGQNLFGSLWQMVYFATAVQRFKLFRSKLFKFQDFLTSVSVCGCQVSTTRPVVIWAPQLIQVSEAELLT